MSEETATPEKPQIPFMTEVEYNLIINQGAILTMLPIETWLEQLQRAETLAAILDPTTYRKYLYSPKPDMMKEVLAAALRFATVINQAREKVAADPEAYR